MWHIEAYTESVTYGWTKILDVACGEGPVKNVPEDEKYVNKKYEMWYDGMYAL